MVGKRKRGSRASSIKLAKADKPGMGLKERR